MTAAPPKPSSAAVLVVEKLRLLLELAAAEAKDKPAIQKDVEAIDKRLAEDEGAYRTRLATLFNLSEPETEALDLAVAVAAEPAHGPALADLQGLPRHLPCEIALRLLLGRGPAPVVRGGSPLVRWGLVETVQFAPDEPVCFRADPAVVDWYFGILSASAIPLRKVRTVEPLPEWEVESQVARIAAILAEKRPVRVAIAGQRGTGRASLADCIATALSKQAIVVDPETVAGDPRHSLFLRLQRLALLGDLALIWRGAPAAWPASLPVGMLQFVTQSPDEALVPVDGITDLRIEMPSLTAATRAALYKLYLPKIADAADALLGQPRVGDLADAAMQKVATLAELRGFLRERNGGRTGHIGRIERPDMRWDDLILADRTKAMLRAFTEEAQRRAGLLADAERRRVFSDAAHLSALFAGPPGLGKSLSAKVIANALGLDLLVVDGAAITSKYIGEFAKNATLAFEIARDAQCALLFEEADSFFTSRVKVETSNDKYSNADVGHLLQLMEHHDGVVMLSSNRRANIDPAFTRRLRFIVEFRKPELAERLLLWERMLGLLGMEKRARDALVPKVAAAHELTPAQIKGAALTAAYRAAGGKIAASDVEEGVRVEFQKEGRLMSAVPSRGSAAHG